MQLFVISNMNEDIRYLCNRSIYMRIHEEWDSRITNNKQNLSKISKKRPIIGRFLICRALPEEGIWTVIIKQTLCHSIVELLQNLIQKSV